MRHTEAMAIIGEASKDPRLTAALDTKRTNPRHQGGYKVKLRQRKRDCNLTITRADDWPIIKDLWSGL